MSRARKKAGAACPWSGVGGGGEPDLASQRAEDPPQVLAHCPRFPRRRDDAENINVRVHTSLSELRVEVESAVCLDEVWRLAHQSAAKGVNALVEPKQGGGLRGEWRARFRPAQVPFGALVPVRVALITTEDVVEKEVRSALRSPTPFLAVWQLFPSLASPERPKLARRLRHECVAFLARQRESGWNWQARVL